jgi:integrase
LNTIRPVTRINALTEKAIQAAKPQEKPYKLTDGGGLHLLVTPAGGRWWRLRYRWQGREQMLSLGVYPDVGLKLARQRRDDARGRLANGVKPTASWRVEPAEDDHTFQAVADAWIALREKEVAAGELSAATVERDRAQLKRWVYPELGGRAVAEITTHDLLGVLKKVEATGKHDTTHRARETCERVFKYAKRMGHISENPADAELFEGVFANRATKHYPAIVEPAKIGELLRAIDGFEGQPATHAALRIAPYVFVRPGELRAAEWGEFNLDAAEWRIPAERMKMKDAHIVPLARQAVAILRELRKLTGRGRYVFPAIGSGERPLSENTLNGALRRLGYSSDEMTPHGFRSMASTLLNEMGFPPDDIELQLAHKERNQVRSAYNRAQRLAGRRKMMQKWADRLDVLRAGRPLNQIKAGRIGRAIKARA